MKKLLIAATLIISTGLLASCQQKAESRPTAPLKIFVGFKKDISTADVK
ncbi:hypothetical protein [Mucilaginibacter hurinus]|nr:hypothetical protein [Mucilaginibacter hurinus]